ncbi:hypothetical protein [Actinomadura sp. 6N118]|uniref:hypothetical protein n=1 Tax=Actinomadura sp. 6N118 TaxID=3375151 RepID=UPI0037986DE4
MATTQSRAQTAGAGQGGAGGNAQGQAGAQVRTITVQLSPGHQAAWDRGRRRVDAVRSRTGRVATAAGTVAAAIVLIEPTKPVLLTCLASATTVVTFGVCTLRAQMPHRGQQKAAATLLYTMPGLLLGGVLVTEWATAGWTGALGYGLRILAIGLWAAGTWFLRPGHVARRMAVPPPPPAPAAEVDPYRDAHPAARWWAANVAVAKGEAKPVAPGTALEDIARTGSQGMTAIIRATTPGQPVPDISIRRLSALMDVPENLIKIGPVPGRGAGVRRLQVGAPDEVATDPARFWEEKVAPRAMPGARLVEIRVGKLGGPPPASPRLPVDTYVPDAFTPDPGQDHPERPSGPVDLADLIDLSKGEDEE